LINRARRFSNPQLIRPDLSAFYPDVIGEELGYLLIHRAGSKEALIGFEYAHLIFWQAI
jgi:hypothetical protein